MSYRFSSTVWARLIATITALLICVTAAQSISSSVSGESAEGEETAEAETYEPPRRRVPLQTPLQEATLYHVVQAGETLGLILKRYGVEQGNKALAAARKHYDPARLQVGDELIFLYERGHSGPVSMELIPDGEHQLRLLFGEEAGAEWTVIPYLHVPKRVEFTIEGSLWGAAVEAGLTGGEISLIAKIFEYEIDFNTELRKGDRFTVVYDELYLHDEFVRIGKVRAVRLEGWLGNPTALRYKTTTGLTEWYSPKGATRRKPFLRSPLAFARVTSGFSLNRLDPVTQGWKRPHRGVDFGAPTGTPVRTVADGVIVDARPNGGYGNYIKVEHSSGYSTVYAHLSKIKVEKGQRVKQGKVIGLVGSTGWSTGPHLHYELHQSGRAVDPLKHKLQASSRLNKKGMVRFQAQTDKWKAALLDSTLPEPWIASEI